MTIPQLRVRTEFTFRQAFGPVPRVAAAVKELGAPAAGVVDGGTWGHVRWAKAAAAQGFKPLFGTEFAVAMPDGRKPQAWTLAEDTAAFYRFSTALRQKEADPQALLAGLKGVVRFAGEALTDPELFDYIDLNPTSPLAQRAAMRLHRETGKPLVVTSDNFYPRPEDYAPFMAIGGREAITAQHILAEHELRQRIRVLDDAAWAQAIKNTHEVAERCAGALRTAPIIHVEGDLRALAEEGRRRRLALGHLPSWPDDYAARLERELVAIEQKNFQSYFIVVADLIAWAKERMLVGPGRGSSAGSLLCYLLGITEVDPIPHGLLFERFIDLTRKDLPDIDIDFSDTKRDQCFDYLADKYGRHCVARIGNVNTLKPRSVMAEVCKRFGIPDKERFDLLNVLIEYSSGDSRYGKGLEDTLNNTDTGRRFMERNPKAVVMSEVENHAWHTGVHAAGVIVCNVPVDEYCTVGADGVAHIDKPDSEYLNLLKIDALGLRTLGIIEDSGVTTADQLYALKLDDPKVLEVFNQRKYTGIFQFEGQSQRSISAQVHVDDFRTVDHLTALARPGHRSQSRAGASDVHPPRAGRAAGRHIRCRALSGTGHAHRARHRQVLVGRDYRDPQGHVGPQGQGILRPAGRKVHQGRGPRQHRHSHRQGHLERDLQLRRMGHEQVAHLCVCRDQLLVRMDEGVPPAGVCSSVLALGQGRRPDHGDLARDGR
jgi:DNA polymerase III alpha subunit